MEFYTVIADFGIDTDFTLFFERIEDGGLLGIPFLCFIVLRLCFLEVFGFLVLGGLRCARGSRIAFKVVCLYVLKLIPAFFDYLGCLVVVAVLFADKYEFRVCECYRLGLGYEKCRLFVRQTFFVGTLATTATFGKEVEIC